ncbi:PilW family protein [Desulfomicrobium escambiense]|uniref:PilW family protein n=1 Tax=Desulfomicrobium escambiense TaxID=29503 RepID=UPI00040956FE|nr:prepilin-type N-terminal cleavage/methylation domain-containing protein [Desulfomicrobium escambiense]
MPERNKEHGMTLVEILVGLVMMGIIVTGIYNLFRVHNLMAAKQEETTMMQQELLTALVDMSEELRMCGFKPMGIGNFGFNATATNQTSIYCTRGMSLNNNSTNIIAYTRNSTNHLLVYMTDDDTWVEAASNISDLRFAYYDANSVEISNPTSGNVDKIRMVEINATATPSPARAALGISNRNMHTRVWLRNMGLD